MENHPYATFFKLLNATVDYFLLNVLLIAKLLFISSETMETSIVHSIYFHLFITNLLWFFSSTQSKIYVNILVTEAVTFLKRTIWALVIFFTAYLFFNLANPNLFISLDTIIPFILMLSLIILTNKILFLLVRKSHRRFWIEYKKIVILGSNNSCKALYEHFKDYAHLGYAVEGYFNDKPDTNSPVGLKYLGKLEESVLHASQNGISEIFSTLPSEKTGLVKKLMLEADNNLIRFRVVPDIGAFTNKNVKIQYFGTFPIIIAQRNEPLQVKVNEIIKRIFDFLFAGFVTIFILSWLIPIIAIAIKIDSPCGSIFFRQLRSGKNNKPFYCLKFRSMYLNNDSEVLQATKNDRRITRVGAFMRRTSIDEFPQFLNVLKGNMSIVGPRPLMLKHTQKYAELIDDFMVRQFVNPGITGWAQVNGLRGETKETESMTKRIKADLWYMENWSFLLDLKIVFLTLVQILKKNENTF